MSRADLRAGRFSIDAPPDGPITVRFVTGPVAELPEGLDSPPGDWEWSMWVQQVGAPDASAALITAEVTPGEEETVAVIGDVAASLEGEDEPALQLRQDYRVYVRAGSGLLAGRFVRSADTTTQHVTSVATAISTPEVIVPVQILVAPSVPAEGGGAELSDVPALPLAEIASPGTAEEASRADHEHPLPTAEQVGAAPDVHGHTLDQVVGAGTAAAADVEDFATSAQGTLATTAVQPAALTPLASLATSKGSVVHGADPEVARPSGYPSVEWIGTVVPDNWTEFDTLVDPTGELTP